MFFKKVIFFSFLFMVFMIFYSVAGTVHLTGYQIEDEVDFDEAFGGEGEESDDEDGTSAFFLITIPPETKV